MGEPASTPKVNGRGQPSHLLREVIIGHLNPEQSLEGGGPREAVLKQETMLFRNEEGQDQHVSL